MKNRIVKILPLLLMAIAISTTGCKKKKNNSETGGGVVNPNPNVPLEKFTLNVLIEGDGAGTVNSAPDGITCPGTCSHEFISGDTVTLTPLPQDAFILFDSWSTDCTGSGNCQLPMDVDKSVTATFKIASLNGTYAGKTSANKDISIIIEQEGFKSFSSGAVINGRYCTVTVTFTTTLGTPKPISTDHVFDNGTSSDIQINGTFENPNKIKGNFSIYNEYCDGTAAFNYEATKNVTAISSNASRQLPVGTVVTLLNVEYPK